MNNRLFILSIILLIICSNCRQKKVNFGNGVSFTIEKNIPYGEDSQQQMDIYLPENSKKEKDIFIIIHGGGWRAGSKSELTAFTHKLMEKFPRNIFVNADYRLASTTNFALPGQTDDIRTITKYFDQTLSFKPRYILLGNSAGANISMLYAYQFNRDNKVKAVINIVGPADLNDPGFKNYNDYSFLEKHMIDPAIVPKNRSLMDFGSPVRWVNKTAPPTLSFYGIYDDIVPLSQMKTLDSVLEKNNVYHESYEFNGNHVNWINEPNSDFLIQKIHMFLKNTDQKKTL
ncbi:alpha/beta hydrolase [Chryseobacterium sp. MHB01]|uniref:alpha/beta hydrolase n=1 Tax=Chryseobacterium sp. MHB01 TaxID=3109433 RepID=UPI002AFF415B|nr:alpha/beta hydrolase [Chryseobacterium sp. MHB01]MEA1849802.1 alpha/beta hydrolase [Chryseobacterium sp. MHB01]